MVTLIVDSRERWFSGLTELTEDDYEQRQLEIGDFYFEHEGQCLCLLERKTVADFVASIHDGRYREQKDLMQAAANSVVWVVEGNCTLATLETAEPAVWTACMKLMIRNKQGVVFTRDKQETTKLLESMLHKIRRKPLDWMTKTEPNQPNQTTGPKNVRSVIRSSYTGHEFVCTTLALVQGVSYESACTLVKHSGWDGDTMQSWIEFLQSLEPCQLADIQMTPKKKVGKVVAGRICDLFLGKKM